MNIPILNPTDRSREYNNYTQVERDKVIYNYLFNGLSHRDLDRDILKLDVDYSRGWQSMGILHHIGLKSEFKGLFAGMSEDEAIKNLIALNVVTYKELIESISRTVIKKFSYGIYDSWEIVSKTVAIKTTDKSVFHHHSSGIPQKTRYYWFESELNPREKRLIRFIYNEKIYIAYIKKEYNSPFRTELIWHSDFQNIILSKYPDYKYYELEPELYPLMRFERVELGDVDTYMVLFIDPEYIHNDVTAEQEEPSELHIEGKKEGQVSYGYSKKYERNPKNRLAAIIIHGCKCACCGFDFEKFYGERGAGFIEIHHNKPLYSLEEEIVINPKEDLIPVCSNCHRMIHRKKDDVLSVEEVKEIVKRDYKDICGYKSNLDINIRK
jgi:5-methylcytosine-specific restriction protein A